MNRKAVAAIIVGITVLVGLLNFRTSAEFVASVLFTFPLLLCAMQRSRRLLWGTAAAAAIPTIATEFWGLHRVEFLNPWAASVNRGLLVASLMTFTTFIHFWIKKSQRIVLDAAETERQGSSLVAQNAQIEVVNKGGKIVLLNVQAEKQFGYLRDEVVGKQVKNIIPEGFAERMIADGTRSVADAPAQQIGTGIELSGRRKNGTQFPIEMMLSPLESPEGILVTAAIRDISVRKTAEKHLAQMEGRRRVVEEALLQSEEQYRMLLDGIQGYAIFMMDSRGQIVSWNAGAERMKSYNAEQIIGRNFSCFSPLEDIERGMPQEVLPLTALRDPGRTSAGVFRVPPRSQREQGVGSEVPRAARGGSGCDGSGEPRRGDCPAEGASGTPSNTPAPKRPAYTSLPRQMEVMNGSFPCATMAWNQPSIL